MTWMENQSLKNFVIIVGMMGTRLAKLTKEKMMGKSNLPFLYRWSGSDYIDIDLFCLLWYNILTKGKEGT